MSKYSISLIDIDEVKKFWKYSPNSNAFNNPEIISFFDFKFDWWQVKKGEEAVCIWPVCLKSKNQVIIPDFFYYFGPMWFKDLEKVPNHSWLALSKNVYEIFIEKFISQYDSIIAQLPIGLLDVRIFDWWNYHEKDKNRFFITPKYTAQIKDLDKLDMGEIKLNFRYWRRNELKKMEQNKKQIKKCNNYSLDEILKLYSKITGESIEASKSKSINSLIQLVKNNYGEIICYRDIKKNYIASFMLLLFGKKESNLILSLVDNDWKKLGLGAYSIVESIYITKKRNLNLFDFNGANSPNRADDKHSYGATNQLFFEINYLNGN